MQVLIDMQVYVISSGRFDFLAGLVGRRFIPAHHVHGAASFGHLQRHTFANATVRSWIK